MLKEFSALGPEQAREAASRIFGLENSRKAFEGRYQGLTDPARHRQEAERRRSDFKARVMANPQWKAAYGSAWTQIAAAEKKAATRYKEQYFHGLDSSLASLAHDDRPIRRRNQEAGWRAAAGISTSRSSIP